MQALFLVDLHVSIHVLLDLVLFQFLQLLLLIVTKSVTTFGF